MKLVTLIPGDGIGPEVSEATLKVLKAADAPLEWHTHQAGIVALEAGDKVLPESTLNAIKQFGVALKGPCTTPVGEGFSSVNVQLRKIGSQLDRRFQPGDCSAEILRFHRRARIACRLHRTDRRRIGADGTGRNRDGQHD